MQLSEPVIRVRGMVAELCHRSGDRYRVEAQVLDIEQGDFAVITGLSGTGKTTLLHNLATLQQPTAVTTHEMLGINIKGAWETPARLNRIRREFIGTVLQQTELLSARTVRENVAFQMQLNELPNIEATVTSLLRALSVVEGGTYDLEAVADRRVDQISGGQAQRVHLASELAHGPGVVFLDEATSHLDPGTTHVVLDVLDELRRSEGLTVVVVTHHSLVIERATCLISMESTQRGVGHVGSCTRRTPRPQIKSRPLSVPSPRINGVQP